MCLAVVALDAHPRFGVVVAANRDEFHARAAAPAQWWPADGARDILAGRDLVHGGTWLGVDHRGRWAFVTNVREAGRHDPLAPSRGALVPQILRSDGCVAHAVAGALADGRAMNGFNVIGGDARQAVFASNRGLGSAFSLARGISGVSNAGLDTPWPKLVRATQGVAAWIDRGGDDIGSLFAVLQDRTPALDADLPSTGLTVARERLLSAPFIVSPDYGTRCSTLVAVTRDGAVHVIERRFDAAGARVDDAEFHFASTPRA